jgi:hypothetical protein
MARIRDRLYLQDNKVREASQRQQNTMGRHFSSSDQTDPAGRLSRASSSSSRSSSSPNMIAGATMPLPQFAKFIPLRLSVEERALLNVLEQTLHVSEYTDHVDVTSSRRGIKSHRILDGILETCHIATGLAVASGHERSLLADAVGADSSSSMGGVDDTSSKRSFMRRSGKNGKTNKKKRGSPEEDTRTPSTSHRTSNGKSWASKDPRDNAALFRAMFEVGRRNKVLNPSSMRTTYGKLMVSIVTVAIFVLKAYLNENWGHSHL